MIQYLTNTLAKTNEHIWIKTSIFDSFDSYWSLNYKKSVTVDSEKYLCLRQNVFTAFQRKAPTLMKTTGLNYRAHFYMKLSV